jgi:hypothetical protein
MVNSKLKYLTLILLILALGLNAKFTKSYLTVSIEINEDGSANVREEIRFRVEGSQDIDLYKIYLKSVYDLEGWRSRLNMDDIRYHLDQAYVGIYETKIYPSKLDTCDPYQTFCYGTFTFEYKIRSSSDEKGIVFIDKYKKPRIITYRFNQKALLFENTPAGGYLPEYTTLEIKIPNSKIISLNPISAEYETKPEYANKFTYHGRLKISDLEIVYEKKESITDEISGFLLYVSQATISWITSKEGIAISIVIILIVISYFLLKK